MEDSIAFFHLANLCEENYRVTNTSSREASVDPSSARRPYQLHIDKRDECGEEELKHVLIVLSSPVFTAHPTEARRKNVERRIRTISELLDERQRLGGPARVENERRMLKRLTAYSVSPIGHKANSFGGG